MAAETRRTSTDEGRAVQRAVGEGRTLAATMPRLILEARRVAASIVHGMHGRRRAGPGENFWQYRRFVSGEPASRVDWRRSARDDHLYVRELEWEAAHTIWIWPDRSPSMHFASQLAHDNKLHRALVIALALAEILVEGGERVGIPGLMRPTGSRNVIERMAQAIVHDRAERASLPPNFAPSPLSEIVLLSDLWSDFADIRRTIAQLASGGARDVVVSSGGFHSGPAAATMTMAASKSRSNVSHHGVRAGVSSRGAISIRSRVGGKSMRRGRGGTSRSSHHSTGRLSRPSSTSGCAKPSGSHGIMRASPVAVVRSAGR